jgi:hypothetical protein
MEKLFVTDYASYNNGDQFAFGHWVYLSNFSSVESFKEYTTDYLSKADQKHPLSCGSKREEPMYTDYEGFPESLYSESMSDTDLGKLFEYLELNETQKRGYQYLAVDKGYDHSDAIRDADDVVMYEICAKGKQHLVWTIFEEMYPDAEKAEQSNQYLSIDYDKFEREQLDSFTDESGYDYLVLSI